MRVCMYIKNYVAPFNTLTFAPLLDFWSDIFTKSVDRKWPQVQRDPAQPGYSKNMDPSLHQLSSLTLVFSFCKRLKSCTLRQEECLSYSESVWNYLNPFMPAMNSHI